MSHRETFERGNYVANMDTDFASGGVTVSVFLNGGETGCRFFDRGRTCSKTFYSTRRTNARNKAYAAVQKFFATHGPECAR